MQENGKIYNSYELYALAKVLPGFTHQSRLQVYTGTLKEAIAQRRVSYQSSLKVFQSLRQELGINENEHWRSLDQLCQDYPELFVPHLGQISDAELTIRRPIKETFSNPELTMQRPLDVKNGQSLSLLGKGNREHFPKGSRDAEKTIQRPFSKKK